MSDKKRKIGKKSVSPGTPEAHALRAELIPFIAEHVAKEGYEPVTDRVLAMRAKAAGIEKATDTIVRNVRMNVLHIPCSTERAESKLRALAKKLKLKETE